MRVIRGGRSAADRGQQGDFVAFDEGMSGGDVFAIDGDGDGAPDGGGSGRGWILRGKLEYDFAGGAGSRDVKGKLSRWEKFPEDAEGQDANLHGIRIRAGWSWQAGWGEAAGDESTEVEGQLDCPKGTSL